MKRIGRVLVMDDEAKWREELSNALRRGGYAVDAFATASEAAIHVQEDLYHVLVLDIRMVDPDGSNVEGMDFLATLEQLGLLDAVEIIMLSAYGTKEQMRKAFRRYKVEDFQTKDDFSGNAFVESMHLVFHEKVRWNGDLDIQWQGIDGPNQAAVGTAIGEERVKRDTPLHARIAFELDDLLRRLFYEASSILVSPMVPGRSGANVLRVQPFYTTGRGNPVVVKFGDFRTIDEEHYKYKHHVMPFVSEGRHTAVIDRRRTPTLGGIVYSFLGDTNFESLGVYYARASINEIKEVLNQLFLITCKNWYANHSSLQPHDLTTDYQELLGFSTENLQNARLERLNSIKGTHRLQFPGITDSRTFLNPISVIEGKRFVSPTLTCITHGDLNDANVLVDAMGHTWLIDFRRTGQGHILRDIAELDTVIRLQMLRASEATLAERLAMEETLAQCSRFSQVERLLANFPTENQALAKAFATSVHLRTIAQEIMTQSANDDISEYYIALMYFALNTIRFYSSPKIQREHALLCASMLAERLGLGTTNG